MRFAICLKKSFNNYLYKDDKIKLIYQSPFYLFKCHRDLLKLQHWFLGRVNSFHLQLLDVFDLHSLELK